MPESTQQDFFAQYIEKILSDNGLDNLTQEQKNTYIPILTQRLQERVGIMLLPKLSQENSEKFFQLTKQDTSAEDWQVFWTTAIPNFEDELKLVLESFASDIQSLLQG